MEIVITVDDSELTEMIAGLRGRLEDMSPVMKAIAHDMLHSVEENFEQEGRPKWKELAPATVKQREKEGYGGKHPILQRSGDLAGKVHAGNTTTSAFVGINDPRAAILNFGGWAGRGRLVWIPARPYLTLTPGDIEDIGLTVANYLTKGME